MCKLKSILTNWDKVIQILTILIAIATAFFAYLSIRTSKKMADEQIKFNEKLNKQEIMLGRPMISCTGNISVFNDAIYNLNISLKNIGKRSLNNLSIEYYVISKSSSGIVLEINERYKIANPLDNGNEQTFFERLPRSNSKKEIFYKIKLDFEDALTKLTERQEFYYIFPKEQQEYLDKKMQESIGLFGASHENKIFIDYNLK